NLSRCEEVISKLDPDFLGLNEINEHDNRFNGVSQPEEIAKACGFPYWYFGKAVSFSWHPEGAYGNAQASKFPYVSTETVHIPDPVRHDESAYYEHRAIIKNVIELPDKRRLCVMQVHVGLAIAEHQNAVVKLCEEIDNSEYPVILMGDFNMCEWDFLLDKIKERLVDTAEAAGKKYFPTYPSNHKALDESDRKIDYIFVSPEIKTLDVGTYQDTASDHLPLWAELEY
ncbi:MAG: endonuclease/exonuclease/phosphatase family protein, partial [Clostridiales bacterium]|nr:endonuclease/exonuclease/phosphatase family protein [Clostridiales bacterium]